MYHAFGSLLPLVGRQARSLTVLTIGVVLAHGALLHGAPTPSTVAVLGGVPDNRPFSTRTIAVALAPAIVAPAARAPAVSDQRQAEGSSETRPRKVSASEFEAKVSQTPVERAQTAPENIAEGEPLAVETVQLANATSNLSAADTAYLPPPTPIVSAAPAAVASSTVTPRRFVMPSSTRLKYAVKGEVKGFPYSVNGELLWQHDGKNYEARLEYSHFLLGSKVQTSKGEMTAQGLAPTRFGDKYRSEVAAHFERNKGKVTFSANTPDVPLQTGAQDQLSVFLHVAGMVGGDPDLFLPGTKISFQAVGPRYSEQWAFVVGPSDMLDLPGGRVKALRLTREPTAEFDTKGEVWLAPEMDYLPVRIRLTQANGDFVDQLWKSSEKP